MFRGKERCKKYKKNSKSENSNKDYREKLLYKDCLPNSFSSKAKQKYINMEYNMKYHANDIRQISIFSTVNNNLPFDENLDIYKTKNKELEYIITHIDQSDKIPLDWHYEHDQTKWKLNKNKTKKRLDFRDSKSQF